MDIYCSETYSYDNFEWLFVQKFVADFTVLRFITVIIYENKLVNSNFYGNMYDLVFIRMILFNVYNTLKIHSSVIYVPGDIHL